MKCIIKHDLLYFAHFSKELSLILVFLTFILNGIIALMMIRILHLFTCLTHIGNPGVPEFYEVFCQTLYKASGYTIPAWAVSHAGHSEVPHSIQEKLKGLW